MEKEPMGLHEMTPMEQFHKLEKKLWSLSLRLKIVKLLTLLMEEGSRRFCRRPKTRRF